MNATLHELMDDIVVILDEPHTLNEVADILHLEIPLALNLMLRMSAEGRIMIAPNTNGQKWLAKAKAKQILRAMDGEDE